MWTTSNEILEFLLLTAKKQKPSCSTKFDRNGIAFEFKWIRKMWLSQHCAIDSNESMLKLIWLIYRKVKCKLTELFDFFANGSLVNWLTVWVQLAWWISAFNVAPSSLLVTDDAGVKWIVTEGGIRCIRWASPTFNGRSWKYEEKKHILLVNFVYECRNFDDFNPNTQTYIMHIY